MTTHFSYVAPPAVLVTSLLAAPALSFPDGSAMKLEVGCTAVEQLSGTVGRTVALQSDADGRRDAAAIVGDDVVVVTAPDPHQYSRAFGLTGVTAIAPMPGAAGASDRLLVAHDGGLSVVSRNPAKPRDWVPVLAPAGGANWVGARDVVAMDVDGDGDMDAVGLDSTGANLLTVTAGPDGDFTDELPQYLGVELTRMVAAPWGLSQPTLAGAMAVPFGPDDTLVVFELDTTVVATFVPGGPIDDLAAVTGASGAPGVVALADDELTVAWATGGMQPGLDVSALAPTALDAADHDGDGRSDVLLNSTVAAEVNVLLQQASGAPFSTAPAAVHTVDLGCEAGAMGGQQANPVGADLDLDGDVDVFQMVEGTRGAVLERNPLVDDDALRPQVVDTGWSVLPSGSMGLFDVVVPALPGGAVPDQLEVSIYSQAPGAPKHALEDLVGYALVDLVGVAVGDTVTVLVEFPGVLGTETSVTVRCHELGGAEQCGVEDAVGYSYTLNGEGEAFSDGPRKDHDRKQRRRGKNPPQPKL